MEGGERGWAAYIRPGTYLHSTAARRLGACVRGRVGPGIPAVPDHVYSTSWRDLGRGMYEFSWKQRMEINGKTAREASGANPLFTKSPKIMHNFTSPVPYSPPTKGSAQNRRPRCRRAPTAMVSGVRYILLCRPETSVCQLVAPQSPCITHLVVDARRGAVHPLPVAPIQ